MLAHFIIDDDLMSKALNLTGLKTEKEVVEVALRTLIEQRGADALGNAFGRFKWEGDLDAMRSDR
ncbi:MAG TPA: type II toxin-antitoxin system VapB family antitoxin [Rhodocyclaceae bacterium]|nr:type II toxin-antitoxin system VapB family antitoxin [Rhodocyclaceae bacterium]